MSDLRSLKVGDKIFVVNQMSRYSKEVKTATETITKVGNKYAYFERHHCDQKFDRSTGYSVHGTDSNARANGQGFDVFLTEHEYVQQETASREFERLGKRLLRSYGGSLRPLSVNAVARIHEILDAEGDHET